MKKMKKIVSVLLVVAMMIAVMPDNCFAANLPSVRPSEGHAGFYGDLGGGCKEIAYDTYYKCASPTSITQDANAEDYNLYFDNANKKLIFNNFQSSGYLIVPTGITIEFKGENSLTDNGGSIEVDGKNDGDITICGDGTLDANYGFEYLSNLKGNVTVKGEVTLNFKSSGISTKDGGITICDNAKVNVIPPSSTNGFAFYTNSDSDNVSADLVITDNAQVKTKNSSIKSDGIIEINENAVVDVDTKLYAEEINIKDNAQVTAAGLYCEAGNVTIDSTKKTTFTAGIQFGLNGNTTRYELKIRSDLDVTVKSGSAISVSVGNLIIGNENRKIDVKLNGGTQGIYLSNANAEITNGRMWKLILAKE